MAQEYHLSAETLHLCVHYTDRFLSRTPVQRSRLQLVGITCMLLACKFEEVNPLVRVRVGVKARVGVRVS